MREFGDNGGCASFPSLLVAVMGLGDKTGDDDVFLGLDLMGVVRAIWFRMDATGWG